VLRPGASREDHSVTNSRPRAVHNPHPSISADVHARPAPLSAAELYLDLLKRTLTRTIVARPRERHSLRPSGSVRGAVAYGVNTALDSLGFELVRTRRSGAEDYLESGHAAMNRVEDAETMIGTRQLDNLQACLTDVIRDGVPGDVLEAGVWRGGVTIFMRGVLRALGVDDRTVWVVDSFEGLPSPDPRQEFYGWRRGEMAVSLREVQGNFARYGLLDDQVQFLKGFFSDTLPSAPIERLAILRIDADLYQSTLDVLEPLYAKLSPGGFAIFDDYRNLADCRRAVDEFRAARGITDPIENIDSRAVFWRKSA